MKGQRLGHIPAAPSPAPLERVSSSIVRDADGVVFLSVSTVYGLLRSQGVSPDGAAGLIGDAIIRGQRARYEQMYAAATRTEKGV